MAHSFLTMSPSLLIGSGFPIVLALGKVVLRLLNPYATAASSMMSHSCRMSGRVAGTSTVISSSAVVDTDAWSDMRVRREAISAGESSGEKPVHELMNDGRAVVRRGATSGVSRDVPSGKMTLTGSMLSGGKTRTIQVSAKRLSGGRRAERLT